MTAGGRGTVRSILPILVPGLLAPPAAFAAIASGTRWILPVLATAVVYPTFAVLLGRGRRGAAIAAALFWAFGLSATLIFAASRDPGRVGAAVPRGPAYRDAMFAYVATGHGEESDPARFLPRHAIDLTLFVVASLATGGLLGLAMGSVLVGFMSYYVGSLAAGADPVRAALLGWPPWAILRVVAFVLIGVVTARPLLGRLTGRDLRSPVERRLLLAAAVLLLLDVALKAALAVEWAAILRPCLSAAP
jgi:hypothetical protein